MTQYPGIFTVGEGNIFRKFFIYITTFPICFCGRDCLSHPNICFSHSPSRNDMSLVLPGHMAAQLETTGSLAVEVTM